MLRRGISERNLSVCAFCQHRLSLRLARLPPRRLLSATRPLHDADSGPPGQSANSGWGRPLFGGPSPPTGAAPGAAPPTTSSLDAGLLPHEIEARKRVAAQKSERERVEKERAAQAPKPGDGPKYIWNAKKQREIQESLAVHPPSFKGTPPRAPLVRHNEPRPSKSPRTVGRLGNLSPTAKNLDEPKEERAPRRKLPPTSPNHVSSLPSRPLVQSRNSKPRREAPVEPPCLDSSPGNTPPLSRLLGSGGSQQTSPPRSVGWGSGMFAGVKAPAPEPGEGKHEQASTPLDSSHTPSPSEFSYFRRIAAGEATYRDNPRADLTRITGENMRKVYSDNNITRPSGEEGRDLVGRSRHVSTPPTSNTTSSWGSLTRKPQPDKAHAGDFWTMLSEKTSEPNPERSQSVPLDDWGKEYDTLPRQRTRFSANTRDSGGYQSRRDAEKVSGIRGAVRRQDQDGWADQADSTVPLDGNTMPPTTPTSEQYGYERKRQPHDSGRNERYEISRGQARKGAKKRDHRSSRFDDEGDEGIDDSYEEYLDRRQQRAERKARKEAERTGPRPINLPELISISNLASALKVEKSIFLDQLAELGFEGISFDSIMAGETAALVAQEYGFEPTVETGESEDLKPRPPPEDSSLLPPRPPVVTIMGHVDHGKTTLLDYLRKSSVAAQEHGGITQHIGAFSVKMSTGKQITFLDTPGHAAFLTMRQRGANVTDIVVLVVAADDSVKPQTLEALKHARSSKVPIIVAINKIDKDGARIDTVKSDLARHGVEIEDYGGDVQVVCVSGKTGQGMDDLEENILTLSEILDMRAEQDGPAEGWILESSLKPIGKAATILVKRGTLRLGDYIAAGTTWAKIRHLRNEAGAEIAEAPPGTPVEILGWRDLPAAGDEVIQGPDERRVRTAVGYREGLREREQDAASHVKIAEQRRLLQEQRQAEKAAEAQGEGYKRVDGSWGTQGAETDFEGTTRMVNFVVKGDVHGSVEAVCACILEIGSHEVRPRVLRSMPGQITESDVEHAATSKSAIVNFNLPINGVIKRKAEEAGVAIIDHTVIYHLSDAVKEHLSSYLEADVSFKVLGEAEVLQIFPINLRGRVYKNVAGCRIRNGKVEKNDVYRVFRDGEKIFEGQLESLKHGRKDITEARKGGECGIGFEEFQDLQVGDQIQAVEEVRTQRTL
ncbi:hypothetical protein JX266_005743 [Neoarthrinium moseri]|nr:hypothetical protein JX266_005743 [Neoarthrinium moseri]